MKKIRLAKDKEGFSSIRIDKDVSVLELKDFCEKINKELNSEGGYLIRTTILISGYAVFMNINLIDKTGDDIGTVEFVCLNDTNDKYYELILTEAFPDNEKWSEEEWKEEWKRVLNKFIEAMLK